MKERQKLQSHTNCPARTLVGIKQDLKRKTDRMIDGQT